MAEWAEQANLEYGAFFIASSNSSRSTRDCAVPRTFYKWLELRRIGFGEIGGFERWRDGHEFGASRYFLFHLFSICIQPAKGPQEMQAPPSLGSIATFEEVANEGGVTEINSLIFCGVQCLANKSLPVRKSGSDANGAKLRVIWDAKRQVSERQRRGFIPAWGTAPGTGYG